MLPTREGPDRRLDARCRVEQEGQNALFIFGILVIGAVLVVGAAYIHDAAIDPVKDPAEANAMVNWEVVSENMREA